MADKEEKKVVIKDKVRKESSKKYEIEKSKDSEADLTVELEEDGDYEVEKLSLDGLPTHMDDGNEIRWLNNFAIKKDKKYIKQKFFVKIPALGKSRLIIYDSRKKPYYYEKEIKDNTFELNDGDPAIGAHP